jgi:tRNA(fMet)-specific endonuclease VapC
VGPVRILLDTCAYSELARAHPDIVATVSQADQIYLNTVVLGELKVGFFRGNLTAKNVAKLDEFLALPRVNLVDIDSETADCYAAIVNTLHSAGTPIPTNDVWIAASAMRHGLQVVTTDTHYRAVPQIIVRCFDQ